MENINKIRVFNLLVYLAVVAMAVLGAMVVSGDNLVTILSIIYVGGFGISGLMTELNRPKRNQLISAISFAVIVCSLALMCIWFIFFHFYSIFATVLAIILLVFDVCCFPSVFKRFRNLINHKKEVSVTEQGLMVKDDLVRWENIEGVRVYNPLTQDICVKTNDCKERIAQAKIPKKWLMKYNYKFSGAVIFIANPDIHCHNFFEECEKYLKKKKKR